MSHAPPGPLAPAQALATPPRGMEGATATYVLAVGGEVHCVTVAATEEVRQCARCMLGAARRSSALRGGLSSAQLRVVACARLELGAQLGMVARGHELEAF